MTIQVQRMTELLGLVELWFSRYVLVDDKPRRDGSGAH